MKKARFSLSIVMAAISLLGSCRKNVVDNISDTESRVYITRHDSTATFSGYQTFRIADSVSIINDGDFIKRSFTAYDSSMLAALTQALTQRGYILITDKTVEPDLGIHISQLYNDYTGIISYDNYWGDYGDYWDPYYWGFGGYGYYFPYSFGTYTIRQGAISIDIIDLKNPDKTTNKLRSVWSALGEGNGIFNAANVGEEVQAFLVQSPYIQH